eukprot:CAMPEP_0172535588 /NCGR_PEP_ID=MMETSP1067-20121228/7526_1 /TAXON_ID=265564 ORGANISM="Thalassiosira punctigera, Strain Tpunct2005C2" /NCGR_SAMPLE_ID=MMETSP1067 /ASSEMBLY_ACC=CAM_ASM_000444 /LENGTH=116 /DNA_ID=CAMNT_0013320527 /DNA_START=573 /DNA_END=923 /DNA_ORIENTATION=+
MISSTWFPVTLASYLALSAAVRNDTVVSTDGSAMDDGKLFSCCDCDMIDFLFAKKEQAPMAAWPQKLTSSPEGMKKWNFGSDSSREGEDPVSFSITILSQVHVCASLMRSSDVVGS